MIPTCSNCRYFVPDEFEEEKALVRDEEGEMHDPDDLQPDSGTCHRHAPQPTMYCFLPGVQASQERSLPGDPLEEDGPDTTAIWPAVDAEDYCGEFKMIDRKKK